MNINVYPIPILKDNYVWAIIDVSQNTAIIVDPGDAAPVAKFIDQQQLQLKGILITHHHWDHTNGTVELKEQYDVPVFAPAREQVSGTTTQVQEGDIVQINDFPLSFRVLDIPGHTLGHVAYYAAGMLFCGDTLFAAGCGRIFEGTPEQMYASLQKIAALPDDTKIYCAHEYTLNNLRFATVVEPSNQDIALRLQEVQRLSYADIPSLPSLLSLEKKTNPFLRCNEQELVKSTAKHAGYQLNDPVQIFYHLREWKNHFA